MYISKKRAPSHPALVVLPRPKEQSRWLQVIKWLLVIPHLLLATILALAASLATLPAALLILATRRLPEPLFNFLLGANRYITRVWAYALLMCDQYPPFSLKEGGYPCDLTLPVTERYNRWLPLVKWLLGIPHLVILELFDDFVLVLAFIAFFGIFFTRRYPAGLFELNLGFLRWQARAFSYVGLLSDRYPPYQLEE